MDGFFNSGRFLNSAWFNRKSVFKYDAGRLVLTEKTDAWSPGAWWYGCDESMDGTTFGRTRDASGNGGKAVSQRRRCPSFGFRAKCDWCTETPDPPKETTRQTASLEIKSNAQSTDAACARALPATSRMNEIECGFIGRFPMCIRRRRRQRRQKKVG